MRLSSKFKAAALGRLMFGTRCLIVLEATYGEEERISRWRLKWALQRPNTSAAHLRVALLAILSLTDIVLEAERFLVVVVDHEYPEQLHVSISGCDNAFQGDSPMNKHCEDIVLEA